MSQGVGNPPIHLVGNLFEAFEYKVEQSFNSINKNIFNFVKSSMSKIDFLLFSLKKYIQAWNISMWKLYICQQYIIYIIILIKWNK